MRWAAHSAEGLDRASTGLPLLRRNAVSNAIGVIVPGLAWITLVPILVRCLGNEQYGSYIIATSFAGALGFLELGLTSSATKFIAQVDVRDSSGMLEKIISGNLFLFSGIGLVIIILFEVFSSPLIDLLFPRSTIPRIQLISAVRLISFTLTMTLVKNAYASVLMGLQRYDIYNSVQVSYAVALAVVQGLVAVNGGGLSALLLANLALLTGSIVAFVCAIRLLLPGIRLFCAPDTRCLRVLFSFGVYLIILNAGGMFLVNMDKLIIGWVLGAESVTYYAVPMQLALKVDTGLAVLVSFLFPLASELQSMGDTARLKAMYLRSTQLIIALDGVVMVFLATFGRELLRFWTGSHFAEIAAPLLAVICLGFLFFALTIIPYHMLLGTGHPKALAFLNSAAVLFATAGLFIGAVFFGLLGAAAGLMIGMTAMLILPWYLQRLLGITWRHVVVNGYGRTVLLSVLASGTALLFYNMFPARLAVYAVYLTCLFLSDIPEEFMSVFAWRARDPIENDRIFKREVHSDCDVNLP